MRMSLPFCFNPEKVPETSCLKPESKSIPKETSCLKPENKSIPKEMISTRRSATVGAGGFLGTCGKQTSGAVAWMESVDAH